MPQLLTTPAPQRHDSTGGAVLDRIRRGILSEGHVIDGPFGPRRITYADDTASGRSVDFIEDYIRANVLPFYANTHSESSGTGLAMGRLREQARRIVHREVGATDEHVVIFCGSGVTAAVNKLVAMLGLTRPAPGSPPLPPGQRPAVLVGPYEHHSNELPWRESVAEVVRIGADARGQVDLGDLERQLRRFADRPLRIGTFSAASNVTGTITDTDAVSELLHAYGVWACWDYAAAGPYLPIRMAPSAPGRGDGKDAVFLSPHKFIGGPQTPGVLVVRRDLAPSPVPTAPGGGTITFVSRTARSYAPDPVMREEGGTPAIVESVRAGLAIRLKGTVGPDAIHARHELLLRRALDRWLAHPAIEILGDPTAPRLPIVSFRVRHGDRLLHHGFVVALLNDLFGIQARGGCSCAGPWGHDLLDIGEPESAAIGAEVDRGRLGVKPGWTRVSFNYVLTDAVAAYIVDAVDLVATHGHRLLGEYDFHPGSGLWRHRAAPAADPIILPGLAELMSAGQVPGRRIGEEALDGYLAQAWSILASRPDVVDAGPTGLPDGFEQLRRFHLPPACVTHWHN